MWASCECCEVTGIIIRWSKLDEISMNTTDGETRISIKMKQIISIHAMQKNICHYPMLLTQESPCGDVTDQCPQRHGARTCPGKEWMNKPSCGRTHATQTLMDKDWRMKSRQSSHNTAMCKHTLYPQNATTQTMESANPSSRAHSFNHSSACTNNNHSFIANTVARYLEEFLIKDG